MAEESSIYALPQMVARNAISDSEFVTQLHGYEDVLYRMAFMYLRNEHDALEAVSEAVYKAYKHKDSLRTLDYFHTWITRTLINTCLNQIKHNKRMQPASEDFFSSSAPSSITAEVEQRLAIDTAVSSLKPDYKTVILLRFYREMSVKDTALVMGRGENTVKTMTRRALAELRKILGEDIFYE